MWRKFNECLRSVMYPEGATPLSFSILTVVFSVTFFSGWITTMVFSFLPKLVQWFGISGPEVGVNVGIIATSCYIGAFISSPVWGWLSDRRGRRFCCLATSVCCVITTLMFGFSKTFWWTVGIRFLQGCSVGQVVVLKGVLKEVCDDTNMAVGMSVLLTAFNVGNIVGPSVGGFTAFPSITYPSVFTDKGLFGKFPALLPNLIVVAGILVGIILTIFYLRKDEQQMQMNKTLGNRDTENQDEKTALLDDEVIFYGTSNKNNKLTITKITKKSSCVSELCHRIQKSNMITVLRTKECLLCCVLFVLFATVDIGFEEMFPIIASTSPEYKGMGFNPSDVGLVLMIVSIVQVVFQLTLLPKLSTFFGPQKFLIISNIVQAVFCPFVPALALLSNRTVMWVGLVVVLFLVRTCVFTGYLSINILVNNSVDIDVIGSANGVTMTASYLGRLVAPVMCGGIYSWSLRNVKGVPGNTGALGFPFDQFLAFFFMSLLSILCAVVTALLPKRMNSVDPVKR